MNRKYTNNDIGIVKTSKQFFKGTLKLDCGVVLENYEICYETYGKLNGNRDNAVLVCHALTADAHAASSKENGVTHKGWWDKVIGPNKAIDTKTHFVICSNPPLDAA